MMYYKTIDNNITREPSWRGYDTKYPKQRPKPAKVSELSHLVSEGSASPKLKVKPVFRLVRRRKPADDTRIAAGGTQ